MGDRSVCVWFWNESWSEWKWVDDELDVPHNMTVGGGLKSLIGGRKSGWVLRDDEQVNLAEGNGSERWQRDGR